MTIEELSASNLTIWYLSKFEPTDFKIDLSTKSGSFKLVFPNIQGLSKHVIMDAKVRGLFPMQCSPCTAYLHIQNMKMEIDFNYEFTSQVGLQINVNPQSGLKIIRATGDEILDLRGLNGAKPGDTLDNIQKAQLKMIQPFLWEEV